MAVLYEINQEVSRLQERVDWNPEISSYVDLDTGEILTEEELKKLFDELAMNKRDILIWMAKAALNDRSEAASIRAEEKRLATRRQRFEKRAERFEKLIERECAGETTDLEVATMKFTMGHPLDYPAEKEAEIISWLEGNGHAECINVKKEIKKTETKKLINGGIKVPDCTILDRKSGSLK